MNELWISNNCFLSKQKRNFFVFFCTIIYRKLTRDYRLVILFERKRERKKNLEVYLKYSSVNNANLEIFIGTI